MLHLEEIELRSRLYQWEIGPHVHHGLYQLLWPFRGAAEVVLDEWRGSVEGPAAVVTPPGVVHGFQFVPGADGLVLTLSARFLVEGDAPLAAQAFRALFLAPASCSSRPKTGRRRGSTLSRGARRRIRRTERLRLACSPVACAGCRLAAGGSPGAVRPRARPQRTPASGAVFPLPPHGRGAFPRTLAARALCAEPRPPTQRLNRLARAESGRPALEIVHERLTREACRRLHYIEAPAEKLALELGFDDPAYFNRFFKRRTGMTPYRWREQRREEP